MRNPTNVQMWSRLFQEFAGSAGTLQQQVKEMLVHAIMNGYVAPDSPVPSSRVLAEALAVSRTTTALALQQLTEKGFLVARARSGCFVNRDILADHVTTRGANGNQRTDAVEWGRRLRLKPSAQRNIAKPADWQSYPYPFIYGQFDSSLFPVADWRECALQALHVKSIRDWAPDHIDRDTEALVEQIQQRLLPARGIWAARDEILVTVGGQHACHLLASLLVDAATVVGMEDPGYPDARNNFLLRTRKLRALGVDGEGLVVNRKLAACDYVYVTPSHQCPTTVTMTLERREALLAAAHEHDFVVLEDDHESELSFAGPPKPALKSLDTNGRVIYLGSLSKTLAHGLRLGFVVAPAELIRELRALRRLMLRHPPTNNAHAAALFLAMGHHDAFIRRLNKTYRERCDTLVRAIERWLPEFSFVRPAGGSALWVRMPKAIDTGTLARQAAENGVLIEEGSVFFAAPAAPRNFARLGYSAIGVERIDEGVRRLSRRVAAYKAAARR